MVSCVWLLSHGIMFLRFLVSVFRSFLLLNSIPFYEYTIFCLFIHQLMDIFLFLKLWISLSENIFIITSICYYFLDHFCYSRCFFRFLLLLPFPYMLIFPRSGPLSTFLLNLYFLILNFMTSVTTYIAPSQNSVIYPGAS